MKVSCKTHFRSLRDCDTQTVNAVVRAASSTTEESGGGKLVWVGRQAGLVRKQEGEVEVKGAWIVYDNCCDRTQPDNRCHG